MFDLKYYPFILPVSTTQHSGDLHGNELVGRNKHSRAPILSGELNICLGEDPWALGHLPQPGKAGQCHSGPCPKGWTLLKHQRRVKISHVCSWVLEHQRAASDQPCQAVSLHPSFPLHPLPSRSNPGTSRQGEFGGSRHRPDWMGTLTLTLTSSAEMPLWIVIFRSSIKKLVGFLAKGLKMVQALCSISSQLIFYP